MAGKTKCKTIHRRKAGGKNTCIQKQKSEYRGDLTYTINHKSKTA